ncbi:MAG: hypothetical protein LBE95_03335 [Holosporaceae bacterium]|nr:hypothetical protein [Holosporaceae bacterium]
MENFDDAKREETIGISNCFYGFHNDKASQAQIWSSPKKEVEKLLSDLIRQFINGDIVSKIFSKN